jgi:hypothetical protein
MIAFDRVVGIVLRVVRGGGDQFVEDPQVRAGLVGGHLDRHWPYRKAWVKNRRAAGVSRCSDSRTSRTCPELVDRRVQVPPPAGHLDVGLVHASGRRTCAAAGGPQISLCVTAAVGRQIHDRQRILPKSSQFDA